MLPHGYVGFPRAHRSYSACLLFARAVAGLAFCFSATVTQAGFYCSGTGPGGNSPDPIGDGSITSAASSFCEAASGWGWNVKTLSVNSTYSDNDSGLTGYDVYCERLHKTYTQGEWRADTRAAGWFVCQADEFFADISEPFHNDQGGSDNAMACSANPINLINGNKYKIHTDIQSTLISDAPLSPQLTRYYNSLYGKPARNVIGRNWRHSYQKYLVVQPEISLESNLSESSDGSSADPQQSRIYHSMQDACLQGFNELVSNNQDASANLATFFNGTPHWNDGTCEVRVNGRYVGAIPINAHYEDPSKFPEANQNIRIIRPDGNEYSFHKEYTAGSDIWISDTPGASVRLDQALIYTPSGDNPDDEERVITYVFTDANHIRETYDTDGKLLTVAYLNGIIETLIYMENQLIRVENSLGRSISFTYNPDGTVAAVSDDTGRAWLYHYENPDLEYALTGLTDELSVRYSTFEYYSDGLSMSS